MQEVKTEIFDERAILVGVATQTVSEQKAKEYLDELAFLAETAGFLFLVFLRLLFDVFDFHFLPKHFLFLKVLLNLFLI